MARRSSSPSSAEADTIAAPAVPPGAALRGIVRVSGPRAVEIAGGLPGAVVRRGPRTYTREDLVEIHLPGAAPLVARCLRLLAERGARPARPGEFTLRAFLHGRLDLAQAEAVERLIAAGDESERRAAIEILGGGWSRRLRELEAGLLDLCADVEAALDFADQDIEILSGEEARRRAGGLLDLLRKLNGPSAALRSGRPKVVLLGRPNAGKSALFNALAGGVSLVSPVAGTTRDVLEAELDLAPGLRAALLDTAGLGGGEPGGAIEAEAERRARTAADGADLVLLVVDAAAGLPGPEAPGRVLVAASKIDLAPAASLERHYPGQALIGVSARTGEGLDLLRRRLAEALAGGEGGAEARWSERQASLLREAEAALRRAVEGDPALELRALDLRAALAALGAITGRDVPEDLLDRVFSRFCLGK